MAIKDIPFPFNPDSEEDVRVALALYFHDAGFTIEDMSFEDSFQIRIGHTKQDFRFASRTFNNIKYIS
jgi:hypothetical protein